MIIPRLDSAAANFIAAGIVLLVLLIIYLVRRDLERRAWLRDTEECEEARTMDPAHAAMLDVLAEPLDRLRRALAERGQDLSQPTRVIHYGKKIDKEGATSVDILRATFYEVGYDVFGVGSDPDLLMVYHEPQLASRGFDRRILEFFVLLDEHGWAYDGFEIVEEEEKEVH